jgi:hypothetical protein
MMLSKHFHTKNGSEEETPLPFTILTYRLLINRFALRTAGEVTDFFHPGTGFRKKSGLTRENQADGDILQ